MSDTDAPVCERKTKRKRERPFTPEDDDDDDDCVHACVGVAIEIYRSAVSGGVLLVRTRWLGRVEETLSIDKWCEDIIIQTCIVVFDAWHEREADDSSD